MTVEEMATLIEFQKQQISDLTAERDRLKSESTNASTALSASHEQNAELSANYNDAVTALEMLGVNEEEETDELDGESNSVESGDA